MSSPVERAEALLGFAARHVPWWQAALARKERCWSFAPTLDRSLIAAHFDDLVAGRAVSRAEAIAHYRVAPDRPMVGGERVFVSAGAHGEPMPVLYDRQAWSAYLWSLRAALQAAGAPDGGTLALVGTDDPAHTLPRLRELERYGLQVAVIGLQDGPEEACARLERIRPDAILGIASAIGLLARMRPQVSPKSVLTGTDALSDETRESIEEAFGIAPLVLYGTTEVGLVAAQCRYGGEMHVNEAWVHLDQEGDQTYATYLANRLQPMIRVRLPEPIEMHRAKCACGGSSLRVRVRGGRTGVVWHLPGLRGGTVAMHPIVLRSALDPLLLKRLPAIEVSDGRLRVTAQPSTVGVLEQRLLPRLRRAGVDPSCLEVVGAHS